MRDHVPHRCEQSPPTLTIVATKDGTLRFCDKYSWTINYCPYCGESADSILGGVE